ncbi:MAG: DUF1461 domain-containing protein [archaeon]
MRYIAIGFLIVLLSLNLVVIDMGFYERNSNCGDNCDNVVKYFFGGDLVGDYSDEELIHMGDVRQLIWIGWFISLVLIGFAVFASKRDFFIGGLIGLGLILLFLLVFINFDFSFTLFHKIFFRNDYWLLPADSLLISMFPSEFFFKSFVRIILYSSIFSVLSIIGGLKWKRKK